MVTPVVSTRLEKSNEKIATNTKLNSDKYKIKLDSDSNTCCVHLGCLIHKHGGEIQMRKYKQIQN